jgi:RNA polymerase sigma-70 factor, ECF subfamily
MPFFANLLDFFQKAWHFQAVSAAMSLEGQVVMPDLTPEELLCRSRAGDENARARLLETFRNYLKLLARLEVRRQLQGKADPSDVVQEVFLAAHRDFDSFRGTTEAELAAWLLQILAARLAGLVRHYQQTKRRDVRLERRLADELDGSSQMLAERLVAMESSPSERASRRERAVLLADVLLGLPEDYREAVLLHHFEGLAFAEVAERMGRSLDGVKKLWVRGLAHLRRDLGDSV